jgi:transcriptional regulator with XRE-family HTH domain
MVKAITDVYLKNLISKKMQQLHKKTRKTIEETAYFLDLDYAQYYRILKGQALPHLATLVRINQAYGLDMNWWFNELGDLPVLSAKNEAKTRQSAADHELLMRFHNLAPETQSFLLKMLKSKKGNFLFMLS